MLVLHIDRAERGNEIKQGARRIEWKFRSFKAEFIEKNPQTVQRIVNAFYKTLKWLETATPEDVAKAVPEEYYLGDKLLYTAAVKASSPMYSKTGIIPPAGMKNTPRVVVGWI